MSWGQDDSRTKAFDDRMNFCVKCGKSIEGKKYTAERNGTKLKIRLTSYRCRGMHKDCAEAWIEREEVRPENAHLIPEIAGIEARYKTTLDHGNAQIDRIQEDLAKLDKELSHAIWTHYRKVQDKLRGKPEPKPRPSKPFKQDPAAPQVNSPELIEAVRRGALISQECVAAIADRMVPNFNMFYFSELSKYAYDLRDQADAMILSLSTMKARHYQALNTSLKRHEDATRMAAKAAGATVIQFPRVAQKS